jgi:hypothetical protein
MERLIERFAHSENAAYRLADQIENEFEDWDRAAVLPSASLFDRLLADCRGIYREGDRAVLDEAAAVLLLHVAEQLDFLADDRRNPPNEFVHPPSIEYRMYVMSMGIPLHDIAVGVFAQHMLQQLRHAQDRIELGEDPTFVSDTCARIVELFGSSTSQRSGDAALLISSVLTGALAALRHDKEALDAAYRFIDQIRPDSLRHVEPADKAAAISQIAISARGAFAALDRQAEGVKFMERLESIAKQHLDDVPAQVYESLLELMITVDPTRAIRVSRELLRGFSGRRAESDSEVLVVARALVLGSMMISADDTGDLVEYWYGVAASAPVSYGSSLFLGTISFDEPPAGPSVIDVPDDLSGLEDL